MNKTTLWLAAALALLSATPASAQKSQDRIRLAFLEAIQFIDPYVDGAASTSFLAHGVFDNLLAYDEDKHEYAPSLAKSIKRIDDLTVEFELQDNVKWHDGAAFDADDVAYTIGWVTDPKTKLRRKADWGSIARVEKLGPHKIRVVTKQPTPDLLEVLAYRTWIYPEHIFAPLEDKESFGTKPVGTGMVKAIQVDRNAGAILLKNPDYKHGNAAKPASNIGRFEVMSIPDEGTQMAHFLRGDLHLIRNTPLEQAEELIKDPKYKMTLVQSLGFLYMMFDVAGRSGLKPVQDPRVRRAMMMAINREEVYRLRSGKHPLPRGVNEALCWPYQEGCAYSKPLPAYDPAGAKKLLAEAGYADGFDIQMTTLPSTKDMAEAVVGQLRTVGIRASVDAQSTVAYNKKRSEGRLNALVSGTGAGGPGIVRTLNLFFNPGPLDYFQDPELHALAHKALTTMDETQRKNAVRELLDTSTELGYVYPVAPIPIIFLHTSDVVITHHAYDNYGIRLADVNWR